jgi:hypothetical protein
MRVSEETLTVPKHGAVLVGPDQLRQVFNDREEEALWLIVGAPEELEFLQGSKSKMALSLIYPTGPKQLPKELAGVSVATARVTVLRDTREVNRAIGQTTGTLARYAIQDFGAG